jgi:hypothetical protein
MIQLLNLIKSVLTEYLLSTLLCLVAFLQIIKYLTSLPMFSAPQRKLAVTLTKPDGASENLRLVLLSEKKKLKELPEPVRLSRSARRSSS